MGSKPSPAPAAAAPQATSTPLPTTPDQPNNIIGAMRRKVMNQTQAGNESQATTTILASNDGVDPLTSRNNARSGQASMMG